uniref:Uncharacterized protein n=1 Tax=Hyaloperonospora arabidopsidis (strain Emoy2) TaxID=559515 RepID=M4C6S9_HYAAE
MATEKTILKRNTAMIYQKRCSLIMTVMITMAIVTSRGTIRMIKTWKTRMRWRTKWLRMKRMGRELVVQLGGGGLEDDPEQGEKKEEEDPEQFDTTESMEEEQAASTVAGTQSKDGQDELEADGMDMEDQEMTDADAQEQEPEQINDDNSSSRAQKQSSSNDPNMKQEYKPQSQVDSDLDQEPSREKRRDRREPNPYRNAQEAQEHWKKRVEMVDRTDEKDSDGNSPEKQEKAANEITTAEFVDGDEEMENVEHALAAADENQVMNQPRAEEEESGNVEKEENELNPGNEASAMDVDEEDSTIPIDERTPKDDPVSIKHEPVPDSNTIDEVSTKPERQEDHKMKAEELTKGEHELVDKEVEHAIPSILRELDLTPATSFPEEEYTTEVQAATPLSPDEIAALRDELDSSIATWSLQSEQERGAELWAKYTALTAGASQRLCEQLRLVLEPMLRAKLEGDYRTGKRINMRKVIPYIASQFRKDKIWMRRTRPSKRQYQVMSLSFGGAGHAMQGHDTARGGRAGCCQVWTRAGASACFRHAVHG